MKQARMHYTYENFLQDCRLLAQKIHLKKSDVIVGIAGSHRRGGARLAIELADIKNHENLYIQSYGVANEKNGQRLRNIFQVHPRIEGKVVYLCGEITESGTTFARATSDLIMKGNLVYTIAIHAKKGGSFIPHYYLYLTDQYIIKPWEKG